MFLYTEDILWTYIIAIMDEVRDTRNQDQFSRTLDARVVRTSPFGRNASVEKAYRRAERLVSALHLLTNHVAKSEPARVSIREKGLKLLSEVIELRDEMRGAGSIKTRAVQASIRELISLIRILTISAFISYHNADVVVDALDELGNFLSASRRSVLSEDIVLGRDELIGSASDTQKKPAISLHGSRTLLLDVNKSHDLLDITDKAGISDNIKNIQEVSVTRNINSIRARNIISVLRSGSMLGIKEICAHFPEYSEKMVQRELAFLLSNKLIRKTGLKRWSRYSL